MSGVQNKLMVSYLKSPEYYWMHYDSTTNRLYRIYRLKDKKSKNLEAIVAKRNPKRIPKKNNAISEIYARKPCYLQIYDLNDGDKLIFDGPVPAPFKVLSANGDAFWAVAGMDKAGLIVRQYQLKRAP